MKRHNRTVIITIFILTLCLGQPARPLRSSCSWADYSSRESYQDPWRAISKIPVDSPQRLRQLKIEQPLTNLQDSQVTAYQKEAVKKMGQKVEKSKSGLLRYKSKHFYLFVDFKSQQMLGLSAETMDILLLSTLVILEEAYEVLGDDFGFKPSGVTGTFYLTSLGGTKGEKPNPNERTVTVSREGHTAWIEISGSDVKGELFDLMLVDMLYQAYTHLVLFYKGQETKKHDDFLTYEVKKALYLSRWTDLARLSGKREEVIKDREARKKYLKQKYQGVLK